MKTPLSLIERLRDPADAEAWRRLVELYTPLIRGWLRRQVPDVDADDVVQEVLGAILRAMPIFLHSGQPGSFRRWLRTTTFNQLLVHWRASRSRPSEAMPADWAELEDPDSELSRAWDREHDQFVVRRLLQLMEHEFSPATWRAFRRQVVDGLPAAAVAAEEGTSVNAVLLAKSRVLARLRKEGQGLWD